MNPVIRQAQITDCEAIARVHVRAWEESYRQILPEAAFARNTVERRTESWREIFRQDSLFPIYVAQKGEALVGFACGGPEREEESLGQQMQLYGIYLLANAKRQGIGSQLLRTVMSGLVSHGAKSACVWTLRDVAPARRFYESFGARLSIEQINHRPTYDMALAGYVWPDLKREFSR